MCFLHFAAESSNDNRLELDYQYSAANVRAGRKRKDTEEEEER